jgi:hypothetical protein
MSSYLKFMFLDSDWRRRKDIDDALESVHQLDDMSGDVSGLTAKTTRLEKQVKELSVTVSVLMRALTESVGLDPAKLQDRVEAELAALDEHRRQSRGPLSRTMKCAKCGNEVLAARTSVSEAGIVCDSCV